MNTWNDSLLTAFSVVRFEGTDQTWYSKIPEYAKFNLQFRPQNRGQGESSSGFNNGLQKNSCCRTPFSEQDWKFKKPLICTIALESCKLYTEAMKCKILHTKVY